MSHPPDNEHKTKRPNRFFRFVGSTLGLHTWSKVFRSAIGNPRSHLDTATNVYKSLKEGWTNEERLPESPETDILGRKKMKQGIVVFICLCAFTLFNFLITDSMYAKIVNGALFVAFLVNMVFCYLTLRNISRPKNSE